jgi:hypothetical protein
MRQAALRTLLVVSERPHPWAFLRDRLDPDLVTVSWARPGDSASRLVPWMLAGTGRDTGGLAAFRDRLVCWHWVGDAPAGLPVRPHVHDDWQEVAAAAERALKVHLAGLRLAPGCGLVLPDGAYLSRVAGLEALLGAHPDGIAVGTPTAALRAAAHRTAALLSRHRLSVRPAFSGGRILLAEDSVDRAS